MYFFIHIFPYAKGEQRKDRCQQMKLQDGISRFAPKFIEDNTFEENRRRYFDALALVKIPTFIIREFMPDGAHQ